MPGRLEWTTKKSGNGCAVALKFASCCLLSPARKLAGDIDLGGLVLTPRCTRPDRRMQRNI
jgi:hypothetical protein